MGLCSKRHLYLTIISPTVGVHILLHLLLHFLFNDHFSCGGDSCRSLETHGGGQRWGTVWP